MRKIPTDGERGEDGVATWLRDVKPGDKLRDRRPRCHVYEAGPNGVLLHVRAIVDGMPVVRWWTSPARGWAYEIIENPYTFGNLIVRDGTPPVTET